MTCLVVEGGEDPAHVVREAREVGAVSYLDGEEALVIDFQDNPERMVGPELYSESAVLRTRIRARP